MNLNALSKAILIGATLLAFNVNAQNGPIENKTMQISRNSSSGNLLTGSMSQNLYKTETYQEPYTVQVPYETTETYTENVPYTVEVPYTEYVTEYRQEYRCRNVTRYRNECRNEQHCYLVPGTPGQCRVVRECGTNAHGQPICKDRQVCDGGSGPTQRCENRQVCQNVPYTDQQCGYEQVPYQREVTRYRTETRYRQETRTRTVTRYRDETRYRQATRQVFDKQLQYQVAVHFPQNAILAPGQSELLNLNLLFANASSVSLELQPISPVYEYVITSQTISGATINVELMLANFKYDLTTAGPSSIKDLKLNFTRPQRLFLLSFSDSVINSSLVASTYKAVLYNSADKKLEELTLTAGPDGKVSAFFKSVTDKTAKIKAVVQITRAGEKVDNQQLIFNVSVAGTDKR